MSVSSGFSGGKQEQKIDIARNRGRLCSLQTTENAELFLLKDDNGKLWVIIWAKYRDLSVASRSIIDHLVFQDVNKWYILIRCKLFFLFTGRQRITWPVNNYIQIMVSSCAMSSNYNILVARKWNHAFLPLAIALAWKWQNARYSLKNKLGDRMIKQLLNSVIAKYRDLSVSRRSIGHFRVSPGLCIKTRLSAQPLIWKWVFILTQIKLIFTRKVVHLASFWK